MKGDPKVIASLQEAANLEASLMNQYKVNWRDAKRFGLDIEEVWEKLHTQCETFLDTLVSRILFLEGDAQIAAQLTQSHANLREMIADALAAETALVARYAEITRSCFDVGDMSNFHYFQHLSKWHREGDEGGSGTISMVGHISMLQRATWQLNQVKDQDFIAVQITK